MAKALRFSGSILAAALLTSALAFPARAKESALSLIEQKVKAHVQRGNEHYDAHRYQEAIEEFEAAYVLAEAPALLFNIAQAQRLKGDKATAKKTYERYIAAVPAGATAEVARDHARQLGEELQREEALARQRKADEERMAAEEQVRKAVEARWRSRHNAGIGVLVAGGLVAGTGGLLYALSASAVAGAGQSKTLQGWSDQGHTADVERLAAPVLVAVGAAVAVTGLVLVALPRKRADARHAVWIAPTPSGLLAGGVF